jgi:hypothetical protein
VTGANAEFGERIPKLRGILRYVELKTGYDDNGPAWIGFVTLSKTGRTVYFNGRALKKMGGSGVCGGNHYDLETGDEFWVSGVKKRGRNRHPVGRGKVLVEAAALSEFLRSTGSVSLDPALYEVTSTVVQTDIKRLGRLENTTLETKFRLTG